MIRIALALLLVSANVAFAKDVAKDAKKTETKEAKKADSKGKDMFAIFETSMGTFKAKLYADKAPNSVAYFTGLAEGTIDWTDPKTGKKHTKDKDPKKLYDGTIFHRVIKDFMIQGGDPLGNGTGDAGKKNKTEKHPDLKHDKEGVLAMANAGADTDGSQFYVTVAATPWLDQVQPGSKGYTIFGQVVEGMDVVKKISVVKTGAMDRPVEPVTLKSVKIERK